MKIPLEITRQKKRGQAIRSVLSEVMELRASMSEAERAAQPALRRIAPAQRESARNLVHYLAIRRHDIRSLQLKLAELGLSSLGRAEAHVLAAVDAVLDALHALGGHPPAVRPRSNPPRLSFADGRKRLADQTTALFGATPRVRRTRIMVTMPSEAAGDGHLIHRLLAAGMEATRINCAHDTPAVWIRIIRHLRSAEKALGRSSRVAMDLAGPKLRTGPLPPGPAVLKLKPARDVLGQVTVPTQVWFSSGPPPRNIDNPTLPTLRVSRSWLAGIEVGDEITCQDARKKSRSFQVVEMRDGRYRAEVYQCTYLVPGQLLCHRPGGCKTVRIAKLGPLPRKEGWIHLRRGDRLRLTATSTPASHENEPAIGCTLPEVLRHLRVGEPIWFDDGKIGGILDEVGPRECRVRITHAGFAGKKLRADKGINLPESDLPLPALTRQDRKHLAFVAAHADIVELSFVNSARDVDALRRHLTRHPRPPAVVLKIETRRGFEQLPGILLAGLKFPVLGVMIARGDLAVECGYERLAEVQEEILWLCEAAHVPVIWATQVLDSLAKKGVPSRAEITDAAMGERAECIMLNKGPHIVEAVEVLDRILRRMQTHQNKKRPTLRRLAVASHLYPAPPGFGS